MTLIARTRRRAGFLKTLARLTDDPILFDDRDSEVLGPAGAPVDGAS